MMNRLRLLLIIAAVFLSAPTNASIQGGANASAGVTIQNVTVIDPVTGEVVFEDPGLTFEGVDSVSVVVSAGELNDIDSAEENQSLTVTNDGEFVVVLFGGVGVTVDAFTEIFGPEFSEETFYDSNAFAEITGDASASRFTAVSGTYSCLKNDVSCSDVIDSEGGSDFSMFELSLNPGDSVTFNLTVITFTVFETPSIPAPDADNDTIADASDNCSLASNIDQLDTDGDGYGNVCDPDFNNDCVVNFLDVSAFSNEFLGVNPLFDLNGDGAVNFLDFSIVSSAFLQTPGPSGLTDTCD